MEYAERVAREGMDVVTRVTGDIIIYIVYCEEEY